MEEDEIIRERIRLRLISLRKEKAFTQEQIGEMIGKSKTAIASWEQGKSLPAPETLYKLAMIYGVTISQMFEEMEGMKNAESIQEQTETATGSSTDTKKE